jgi:hypothetical protein
MDYIEFEKIREEIPSLYAAGSMKMSSTHVKLLTDKLVRLMRKSAIPASRIEQVKEILELDLKKTKTKKGILAREVYDHFDHEIQRELKPFFTGRRPESSIVNQISTRDTAINRLEKELRDIRSMVAAPDIEQKLKDLQTQVEAIQRNTDSIASVAVDAAEDLLKKFISTDKKVFVIMPFRRDLENVWLGAIKPACKDCNFASLRVDEVNLSSLITEDIERFSTMANVVIVDITDNNPNVMFEFGWALAKNKKPIVICQGDETGKVPFDIRAIRYIPYENSWLGIENLRKRIKEYLQASESQPTKKSKKKAARTSKAKTNRASSIAK